MEERLSSVGATEVGSARSNGARSCILGASPSSAFVAATTWLEGGVPVVSVTGELDLATAPVFEEALLDVSEAGAGAVIVDLARCSFIDLRGLRVLLAANERHGRADQPLALVVGNPTLLRIFKITRVADRFEIYPSLAAAAKVNGRG
jgi:anti-anti-sigma factor